MLQLHAVMASLSQHRPVFHSEKDLQFALAWEIKHLYQNANIRLETRPPAWSGKEYLDIQVGLEQRTYAIETKYKTRTFKHSVSDELFLLANHGAQDCGAYDFWKDIRRLERLQGICGYALLLTNDESYWKSPTNEAAYCADFRINEGRKVSGLLSWREGVGGWTKQQGRDKEIPLFGSYDLAWRDYSSVASSKGGRFRYLLIPAVPGAQSQDESPRM